MKKLKARWNVHSNFQLFVIFVVFALTGSASAWLSRPLCEVLGISKDLLSHWYTPVRLLLIFPIYQVLLVANGFLFGQFTFFWNFEKKLLRSLKLGFLLPKEPQ
jgi:hypothetical protein